jgi:hypothetical protein
MLALEQNHIPDGHANAKGPSSRLKITRRTKKTHSSFFSTTIISHIVVRDAKNTDGKEPF